MKVLYISQYFPPEMGAPAARVSELARHWVEQGHEVDVLTGFPNHPAGVVHPEYRAAMRRLVMRETFAGVRVTRTWVAPLPNRKSWERVLNYSSFALSASITGTFLPRPEVVIATSPQLLVGLAGWWLSRIRRARFIFEVRDLWPESLAAVGVGAERSLMYRILHRVAGFLYRASDEIVVVTPAFKRHLIAHWNVPAAKIHVVENGVETEMFRPDVDTDRVRRDLALEGKLVVSYIGTLGNAAKLETVIDAAERLRTSVPDAVLLLAGAGAESAKLKALAAQRDAQNVRFLGEQPREKVPGLIAASDICLVLLRNSDVFQTVIPTKMLEFMACGRSVILGVSGQAQEILEAAHAGIAIEPESSVALAQAIEDLARFPERRREMGQNARKYILQRFSRRETARQYAAIFDRRKGFEEPAAHMRSEP